MHSTWPSIVELIGHTGIFDYVEFLAEYAPFDLYALENFCRAAELHDLSTLIKIDAEPRRFLAQRSVGSGFDGVLFADCRTADEARSCVSVVRAETPEAGGTYGAGMRRSAYMGYGGDLTHVEKLQDVVIGLMIEKRTAVESLDEILAVDQVTFVQWGPADYAMSTGRAGEWPSSELRAVEKRVIEAALEAGVAPRAEIDDVEQVDYYLSLGVRHFCLGTDLRILYQWLGANGSRLRDRVSAA